MKSRCSAMTEAADARKFARTGPVSARTGYSMHSYGDMCRLRGPP